MISAEDLASKHTSFWRSATPMLDGIVRTLNSHPRRYAPKLETDRWTHRRAFIAEVAFAEFQADMEGTLRSREELVEGARARVAQLVGRDAATVGALTNQEAGIARQLQGRISDFVAGEAYGRQIAIYPPFPGCGVLSAARGDLRIGRDLYEVKAVDRTFRAIDVKQLLVYGALDYARTDPWIRRFGLLNPLQGVWELWDVNELCLAIGGLPAPEIYRRVIAHVSSDLDALLIEAT